MSKNFNLCICATHATIDLDSLETTCHILKKLTSQWCVFRNLKNLKINIFVVLFLFISFENNFFSLAKIIFFPQINIFLEVRAKKNVHVNCWPKIDYVKEQDTSRACKAGSAVEGTLFLQTLTASIRDTDVLILQ